MSDESIDSDIDIIMCISRVKKLMSQIVRPPQSAQSTSYIFPNVANMMRTSSRNP